MSECPKCGCELEEDTYSDIDGDALTVHYQAMCYGCKANFTTSFSCDVLQIEHSGSKDAAQIEDENRRERLEIARRLVDNLLARQLAIDSTQQNVI